MTQGKARASAFQRPASPSSQGARSRRPTFVACRVLTWRNGYGTHTYRAGGTQRLTRTVGIPMAKRLIFTGEELGAAAALQAGAACIPPVRPHYLRLTVVTAAAWWFS